MKQVYLYIEQSYVPTIRVFSSWKKVHKYAQKQKISITFQHSNHWMLRSIPRKTSYGYIDDAYVGRIERHDVK